MNDLKRLITEKQEQVLRLCHQDFQGLGQIEAANEMGISQSALSSLLAEVKKILPQFFPLLTKLEAQLYHYYMVGGWNVDEIAIHMDKSQNAVYKGLKRAKDKGMYFTEAKGRVLSYEPSMDGDIKQKF